MRDCCMEYIFYNNHLNLLDMMLRQGSQDLDKRVSNPQQLLSEVDRGQVSQFAYCHRVKKVQMMKGNKQGNNALVLYKDNKKLNPYDYICETFFIMNILHSQTVKYQTIKAAMKLLPKFEKAVIKVLQEVVRAGNQDLAFRIIKKAVKLATPGLTKLHSEVLGHEFDLANVTQQ